MQTKALFAHEIEYDWLIITTSLTSYNDVPRE